MEKGFKENSSSLIKIAITGPESTGKSLLTEQLAKHFNTVFVPEYAREYIDHLNRKYEQHDILEIAKTQLKNETKALSIANKFLFCDTEFLVTKIWSEHAYGNCDEWIKEKFKTHKYDLYLLMDIDLPWEYDEQREHPHMRTYFFNWYRTELEKNKLPFVIISGTGIERLNNALEKIHSYFKF
ncbi:MAG TPA: ATP-binding protein [Bacteroidales bacterium]|nr:ATP-binding protein [Bacteroidales bacterium]HPS18484.1 ATP-binding protein [Bacteroidales bacterium]